MKKVIPLSLFISFNMALVSQNVGINTTGAAPAATNLLEVLNPSTTASSIGIYSLHSGAIAGTGYGIWAEKTGASTTNVAGYFSASGATNNYAIIVPASGGSVGIGTSAPATTLTVSNTDGRIIETYRQANLIGLGSAWFSSLNNSAGTRTDYGYATFGILDNTAGFEDGFFSVNLNQEGVLSTAGGWPSQVMRIISNGNMVIGYTGSSTPEATLEVQALEGTDASFALDADDGDDNGDTWFIKSQAADNDLTFTNHASELVRIMDNGNVGIGTNSPSSKFHVNSGAANTTAIETIENTTGDYQSFVTTASPNTVITGSIGDIANNVTGGVLYYKTSGTATNTGWTALNGVTGTGWNITGNSGTVDGTNFIGTTDNVPFNIRVNNAKAGRLEWGSTSTYYGIQAGNVATLTSQGCTAVGRSSLEVNATGYNNTAVGYQALQDNNPVTFAYEGSENTAVGNTAMANNTIGRRNTGIGSTALNANTDGTENTAVGFLALQTNISGSNSVAIGNRALEASTGSNNIGIGSDAGSNITSGSNNIIIGYSIAAPVATSSNQMSIGNLIFSAGIDGTGTTVSSGSIGIGAVTPEAKLEVQGTEGNDAGIALDADDGDDNADTWFIKSLAADNDLTFTNHVSELVRIMDNGNVGIGTANPSGKLQIAAGTTTVAPFLLTSGTNLTTPAAGAVEFDGTEFYATPTTARYIIPMTLKGSATLDFPSTAAGASSDLTITVTGAADGDPVFLGVPNGSTVATGWFTAWVSAADTVTVRFHNNIGGALDPASGTFKVTVNK